MQARRLSPITWLREGGACFNLSDEPSEHTYIYIYWIGLSGDSYS